MTATESGSGFCGRFRGGVLSRFPTSAGELIRLLASGREMQTSGSLDRSPEALLRENAGAWLFSRGTSASNSPTQLAARNRADGRAVRAMPRHWCCRPRRTPLPHGARSAHVVHADGVAPGLTEGGHIPTLRTKSSSVKRRSSSSVMRRFDTRNGSAPSAAEAWNSTRPACLSGRWPGQDRPPSRRTSRPGAGEGGVHDA